MLGFFFFKFRLDPWSRMPQQRPLLPSCGVKDRADVKWREKSLFWQQAKGRRAVLAAWGVGQPYVPSCPLFLIALP